LQRYAAPLVTSSAVVRAIAAQRLPAVRYTLKRDAVSVQVGH